MEVALLEEYNVLCVCPLGRLDVRLKVVHEALSALLAFAFRRLQRLV